MDAENFIINNCSKCKIIKYVSTVSPYIYASILPQAFIIKSINLRYLSTFVIAPDQCNSFGVSHFKCQKQQEGFNGVKPSVYEITHEQVICHWAFSPNFKKFHQVVKLSMNVSAYSDRSLYFFNIVLLLQDFLCSVAKSLYLRLFNVLASFELFNLSIQVCH